MKHTALSKYSKTIGETIVALTLLIILAIVSCDWIVTCNASGRLYSEVNSVPPRDVGLLLGTTPQTRVGRRSSQFFKYRIDATEELYKAHKIRKVLISGDGHSLDGINEAETMRDSLVNRGVKASDILLDDKGYRTINSVENATNRFGLHSYIIISQRFHNERALYIAEHIGCNVNDLIGFNAKDAKSNMAFMTYVREYFARVKMFIDLSLY